jgi:rSAM/selenodomain-associated transferase 2
MKVSIIVPILNEIATLPALLEQLRLLAQHGCEVILVDGGSVDGSPCQARCAGFTVLQAPRSRAGQMNLGAAQAKGDLLLFLHADTRLPDGATTLVTQALTKDHHHWGRFDVRIAGKLRVLRLIAWFMNHRSHLTGIATGDQAIFVTRAAFDTVGGFPDQPLMEDIEISKQLRHISKPARIRRPVTTSGRRWEQHGAWRTVWLMWRLRWHYWRGVPASELAKVWT